MDSLDGFLSRCIIYPNWEVVLFRIQAAVQHDGISRLSQNTPQLWRDPFDVGMRVIWNRELRKVRAAIQEQMALAPPGDPSKNRQLAEVGTFILHENDRAWFSMEWNDRWHAMIVSISAAQM